MTSPSYSLANTYYSFAKLNLALAVFSPHKSNLHPIQSIFQQISLHDVLNIDVTKSNTPTLSLTSSGLGMPLDESNILCKIFNHYKPTLKHNYSVHVDKHIPMGSGMGGSSSNAAVFLKALNQLDNLNFSTADLIKESYNFGSDVSFFIQGGQQLVSGLQDSLLPIEAFSERHFVIVYPHIHCSTAAIYNHFDALLPNKPFIDEYVPSHGSNDLLAVALDLYPELNTFYIALTTYTALPVYMTGSGSTFFIDVASAKQAKELCLDFKRQFPNSYIQPVKSLGHSSSDTI